MGVVVVCASRAPYLYIVIVLESSLDLELSAINLHYPSQQMFKISYTYGIRTSRDPKKARIDVIRGSIGRLSEICRAGAMSRFVPDKILLR